MAIDKSVKKFIRKFKITANFRKYKPVYVFSKILTFQINRCKLTNQEYEVLSIKTNLLILKL